MYKAQDNIEKRGFIDKEDILKYVSEEDIFEMVFNFKPKEYDYVTSPFRQDDNAGCWFEYSTTGKLKFKDFGSQIFIRGKKMINIDCFDAVQVYYNLPNLYKTILFIKKHLIDGKELPERKNVDIQVERQKKEVKIQFEARDFDERDAFYWKKYGISRQNLIDDKVFAVKRFKILNGKFGDFSTRTYDSCYAYTEFEDSRKKLYRPHQKGKNRFITTCNQNDIGGINILPEFGDTLIITKSYKDWRVLKNQGLTSVWFQNEGMIPTNEVLLPLCKRFKYVIVFFDNDKTGIESSQKIENHINSYFPGKCFAKWIDVEFLSQNITDPSDFIHKKGEKELKSLLNQMNIL